MLTEEQIDFFHENGYLIMRNVIQGEELRLLREAVDQVQAQGVAGIGDDHLYMRGASGKEIYWRTEKMWNKGDIFQAVTVHPELLENIGQCIGETFFPWNDSLVVKLAREGTAVTWHQDPPYGDPKRGETFPTPNFTTDIYLDDSGPDNGCVWAIPGRHLVGHVDLSKPSQEEFFSQYGAVPIEMKAGDVLFHCLSTPHGSAPNRSEQQRRIFYIHYLNHQVAIDGYGKEKWSQSKPIWGEEKKKQIYEMMAKRESFGFELPNGRSHIHLGEGGFSFLGEPTTPPSYWRTLRERMSEEETANLKVLKKIF